MTLRWPIVGLALLLAACSGSGSQPKAASSFTHEIHTYAVESKSATSYDEVTPTPQLQADPQGDTKLTNLLYGGPFAKEFVTQQPSDWLGIAHSTCDAYGRVGQDAEPQIMDILQEQLSVSASRWFIASTLTLLCPQYEN